VGLIADIATVQTVWTPESGRSNAEVSLSGLFEGNFASCRPPELSVEDIAMLISTGGWVDVIPIGALGA